MLGLLTERDVKINFDREKLLEWLSAPKSARKSSKDFADELGVSYSTSSEKELFGKHICLKAPSAVNHLSSVRSA